ncbi:MAG: protease-like activity factor CPAF [Elusimicrobia bacterium]|nr:protease-like activity factor CPAF [Elusimicrobiota bacterium]
MKKALVRSLAVAVSVSILVPAPSQAAIAASLQAFTQRLASGDAAAALGAAYDKSAPAKSAAFSATTLPSPQPISRQQLKTAMLQNLDVIQNSFSSQYGPGQWKQEHGWDLDAAIAQAKKQVADAPSLTMDQYHDILRGFFNSVKDYHVSVQFDATEASSLPFMVSGAGGRYYIQWIDRKKLPESVFPFHEGDELVSFGGRKTADVIAGLQSKLGGNTSLTDRALASMSLTSRRAASGGGVTKGPVSITVKPQGSDQPVTTQLAWNYVPEFISDPKTMSAMGWGGSQSARVPMTWTTNALSPVAESYAGPNAANPLALGGRDGFLPALGEKTWESGADAVFKAYVYKTPAGRSVGYVRIPSYEVDDAKAAVAEFAELAARFQAGTDALVIDETNNPGGAVLYLYALVSMLTDRPLAPPRHKVAITQDDVAQAIQYIKLSQLVKSDADAQKVLGGTDAQGYPVDLEFFQNTVEYSAFVMDQWNQGKTLTDPVSIEGVKQIRPSAAARYTKPLLVLINELDFSGGDFFPAIMQDNKRATLFGTRTAGAGGFVREVKFPNTVGVAGFSMTGSIAVRANNQPIENLGVTADIQYQPSSADLQGGFQEYAKAVNKAVAGLLGSSVAGR